MSANEATDIFGEYDNGLPAPIASGVRANGEDECWVQWAVYDAADFDADDTAVSVSGWRRWYDGPGRGFAHDAYISRRSAHHVVVCQVGGLDV
jgi:hypothetical protein